MDLKSGFTRILVTVDGSDVSMRAAEHAARIAKEEDAEIVALNIIPTPPFHQPGELASYFENAQRSAKKWMREVEVITAKHGLSLKSDIVVGAYSVVEAILDYAERTSVDLIVTGTRGMTPSTRVHVGSVASGLVGYAPCPVLVVR